jgi:RimJ/RimL family protein N-acetyltransferase
MDIEFHKDYFFSKFREGDQPSLIEHINDYEVYKYTLTVPYPYTQKDADWWIAQQTERYKHQTREESWCLRFEDKVIGAIDFSSNAYTPHRAEIGYWIGRKHWGKGVVTAAVKKALEINAEKIGYTKIVANVYEENVASQRVLEKTGFFLEAKLRKHYSKDGLIKDGRLYSLIRD